MIMQAARRLAHPLAAALAVSLLATPATAQWFGQPFDAPMSPRAVAAMLYGQGFREVDRPRWIGDRYLVEGVDRFGIRVRLAVDPYGDVLGRRNLSSAPVPPREVGRGRIQVGPIDVGPIEVGRIDPFRNDAREAPRAPASGRESERRREPLPRQAARPEPSGRTPAASRAKPQAPVAARAPEPVPATPAAAAPAATRAAPEQAPAAPAASPAAPAPSIAATRPDTPREPPTAAAPSVRVIEGVTPVVPRETADKPRQEPEPPDVPSPVAID